MAGFINTNALKYGNESVDTQFSPLVEANLWLEDIFRPGVTFSKDYEMGASGQIMVRKLGKGTVDTTAGFEFTHEQTADELISIVMDVPYKKSEAIYERVEQARTSGTGMQKMEVVVKSVNEKWQQDATTNLIAGATALPDTGVTAQADVEAAFLSARKQARDNYAKPDVAIVSTNFYMKLLNYAGNKFRPTTNDDLLRTGQVGVMYDIKVFESPEIPDTGTAANNEVEFVLYDHRAYSIVSKLIASRIVDASPLWTGSAAQFEMVTGFKITNPERVYKKTIA